MTEDAETQWREERGYSQQTRTHGTLVPVHSAIRASDRVALPGAYKHPIPHLAPELTAEFLGNEENVFSEQFSTLPVHLPIMKNN